MPAPDAFAGHAYDLQAPCRKAAAVTPHDTNELAAVSRFLYVGGAGAVKVKTADNDVVVFAAVPAGTTLPLRVRQVFATDTTATNIVAMS